MGIGVELKNQATKSKCPEFPQKTLQPASFLFLSQQPTCMGPHLALHGP